MFLPTPRNSCATGTPIFAGCSGSPTPDNCKMCGEPIALADRILSRAASARSTAPPRENWVPSRTAPRDFARSCQMQVLLLADDTPAHQHRTSVDVASPAPNAEVTVFPWREPPELKERTINRVRTFLKAHQLMRAAAQ
jgi:hypothetical protein